jgi:hypothetical protein
MAAENAAMSRAAAKPLEAQPAIAFSTAQLDLYLNFEIENGSRRGS